VQEIASRIEQPSSRSSLWLRRGIGKDPNRQDHHIEASKLKLLLQRRGRMIVEKTADGIFLLKNQLAGKKD
jgi:hypothetical protein